MFNHIFSQDLDILFKKIESGEPFAFARFADGELAVIENKKITGCDGWSISDDDKLFGAELLESLSHTEKNYFYGISCPCCDIPAYIKLKGLLNNSWDRVTFSNLFVNSNWEKSFSFFMNYKDKVFICNEDCKLDTPFFKVPSNVISAYRTKRDELKKYYEDIAEKNNNTLFCISAGPLAELIIHWMYNKNKNNQYVDTGSCLDLFLHRHATRDYHYSQSNYSKKNCIMYI